MNGDNLLPNLRRDEDKWKVVLIEEEFTKSIFCYLIMLLMLVGFVTYIPMPIPSTMLLSPG